MGGHGPWLGGLAGLCYLVLRYSLHGGVTCLTSLASSQSGFLQHWRWLLTFCLLKNPPKKTALTIEFGNNVCNFSIHSNLIVTNMLF